MVIVDTDFLSSFSKINRLKLILKSLNIKKFVVPSTVYGEIQNSNFFEKISHLFVFKEEDLTEDSFILVKNVNLNTSTQYFKKEEISVFGKGEIGCFLLAKETNDKILIDDRAARDFAKENHVKVVSVPAFLMECKNKNIISSKEMKQIIKDLKEKDYYEFTKEIEKLFFENGKKALNR
ncbi:MAG: hypothetical protein AABX33_08080 [Nanoarchaeota archaeon]